MGGILSIIGSALSLDPSQTYIPNPEDFDDECQIPAPTPTTLSNFILSETKANEHLLMQRCVKNLDAACIPPAKIQLGILDVGREKCKVQKEQFRNQFDFILCCDGNMNTGGKMEGEGAGAGSVNSLAKTVSQSLAKNMKKKGEERKEKEGGEENFMTPTFLHIAPDHREGIHELEYKLSRGYKLNANLEQITLERMDLQPQIVDTLEEAIMQVEEEIEHVGTPAELKLDEYDSMDVRCVERREYCAVVASPYTTLKERLNSHSHDIRHIGSGSGSGSGRRGGSGDDNGGNGGNGGNVDANPEDKGARIHIHQEDVQTPAPELTDEPVDVVDEEKLAQEARLAEISYLLEVAQMEKEVRNLESELHAAELSKREVEEELIRLEKEEVDRERELEECLLKVNVVNVNAKTMHINGGGENENTTILSEEGEDICHQ